MSDSAESIYDFYGIPDAYRDPKYTLVVQLHFGSDADVFVKDEADKLVWQKHGALHPPIGRMALPREIPPKGGNGDPAAP